MKNTVLDKDYKKVDKYSSSWLKRSDTFQGKVFSYIFPAEVNLEHKYSSFNDFYFNRSKGANWIILNVIFLIAHVVIIRKRRAIIKNHVIDLAIIFITGIYGFIAINIFPNKFYD